MIEKYRYRIENKVESYNWIFIEIMNLDKILDEIIPQVTDNLSDE